jgi:hypothetical protein
MDSRPYNCSPRHSSKGVCSPSKRRLGHPDSRRARRDGRRRRLAAPRTVDYNCTERAGRRKHSPAVVLTCRTANYLNRVCSDAGAKAAFVQDATVVTMQSLDVDQIASWLRYRFPDLSQAEGVHERWRPVVAHLRQHPEGPLASSLKSPLFLYLAVTTYQDTVSVPSELCELETSVLERHLFSRLIPAVVEYHPKRDGRRYDSEDVSRWLRTFANHLARMEMRGFSGVDLKLRELWRSAGSPAHPGWGVRWCAAAAIAIGGGYDVSYPGVVVRDALRQTGGNACALRPIRRACRVCFLLWTRRT